MVDKIMFAKSIVEIEFIQVTSIQFTFCNVAYYVGRKKISFRLEIYLVYAVVKFCIAIYLYI